MAKIQVSARVDDAAWNSLKERAKRNHRSINAELENVIWAAAGADQVKGKPEEGK